MSALDHDGQQRAMARMARVDAMDPELREVVHDFGLTVVDAFLQQNIKSSRIIRHLIWQVLRGSREVGNRSGMERPRLQPWPVEAINDELALLRLPPVGERIASALIDHGKTLVPIEPSDRMVAASIAALDGLTHRVTKEVKHRLRLRRAIAEAMKP